MKCRGASGFLFVYRNDSELVFEIIYDIFFSLLHLFMGKRQEVCLFYIVVKSICRLVGLLSYIGSLLFSCRWDRDLIVNYSFFLLASFCGKIE